MRFFYILIFIVLSLNLTAQSTAAKRTKANQLYRDARIFRSDKAFEQSNILLRNALPIFQELKMWSKYLSAIETMAENFTNLEKSDSLKYYWEFLAGESVRFIGKNNRFELNAYNALAEYYTFNEQYDYALALLDKALSHIKSKALGREAPLTSVYTNIALIYEEQQLFDRALEMFETAEKSIIKKASEPTVTAKLYFSFARTLWEIGEFEKALEKSERAAQIYASLYSPNSKKSVELLLLQSEIYAASSKLPQAEKAANEALRMLTLLSSDPVLQIKAMSRLATILELGNKVDEAERNLILALSLAEKSFGKKHPGLAMLYHQLAEIAFKKSDYKAALSYAENGMAAVYLDKPSICLSSLKMLKLLKMSIAASITLGNLDAQMMENKVLDFLNNSNRDYLPLKFEAEFRQVNKALCAIMVDFFIQNNPEKAIFWAELSKQVSRRSLLHIEEPSSILWGQNDSILFEIRYFKLQKLMLLHEIEQALDKRLKNELQNAVDKWTDFDGKLKLSLAEIQRKYPDYYQRFLSFDFNYLSEIKSSLKEALMLVFVEGENDYYRLAVDNNKITGSKIDKKSVNSLLLKMMELFAKPSGKEQFELSALHKLLMPDIKDESIKQIIIVPDGQLWNLPFELLGSDAKKLVINKYALRYIWSVGDLLRKSTAKGKDLCFFTTNYKKQPNNKFSQFQSAYKEAKLWTAKLNANKYRRAIIGDYELNQNASETHLLKKNISNFAILHLAYFAEPDLRNPISSKLLTSFMPDSLNDAVFYLNELSARSMPISLLNLNIPAPKSGFNDAMAAKLLAFEAAGAESIIWTSLEVETKVYSQLMIAYYKNLAKGLTKTEALRQAKLALINKYPLVCASIRLYGQEGTVEIRAKFPFPWFWSGLALALLLFLLIWYLRSKSSSEEA